MLMRIWHFKVQLDLVGTEVCGSFVGKTVFLLLDRRKLVQFPCYTTTRSTQHPQCGCKNGSITSAVPITALTLLVPPSMKTTSHI